MILSSILIKIQLLDNTFLALYNRMAVLFIFEKSGEME